MMRAWLPVVAAVALSACAGVPKNFQYAERLPAVIVVLPPVNETADVAASDQYLATISRPLADAGYYVLPVAVVDKMMKENGLPTPGDMHAAPLSKLREVLGADAVLYVTIKSWSTLPPDGVKVHMRLVDTKSGDLLWEREYYDWEHQNSGGGSGIAGLVASAVVTAVVAIKGPDDELVRRINTQALNAGSERILRGKRHPDFAKEQADVAAQKP